MTKLKNKKDGTSLRDNDKFWFGSAEYNGQLRAFLVSGLKDESRAESKAQCRALV
jgi:hypothetical protein